jgi:hypothetical protein
MKYGLYRIHIKLFTPQLGWLGAKRIELFPWDMRIKFHKWHSLWSTLEYWPDIPYLLRLPRLGGYLGEAK